MDRLAKMAVGFSKRQKMTCCCAATITPASPTVAAATIAATDFSADDVGPDISSDNVVPSDRIANADIDYIGAGDTAISGKKGWYSRFLENISPI